MKCFLRGPLICLLALLATSSVAVCQTPDGQAEADADRDGRRARRQRDDGAPKVGDVAPLFGLNMLEDKSKTVKLASFRGKRPVILFFGSYT